MRNFKASTRYLPAGSATGRSRPCTSTNSPMSLTRLASTSRTETAPLGRFRLARGALYRLRTTDDGAVVDRFDLEVPQ